MTQPRQTQPDGTASQIAGLAGPAFAAIGVGALINQRAMADMATQLAGNTALVFIAGLLSLVAGVAIVRAHNVWSGGWPVVVTVVGWLAIVGGLVRMWFPDMAAPIAASVTATPSLIMLAGVANLALGAFLTFKAYQN